ncbi:cell surface protein, partial [Listeria monocytogenes]
WGVPGDYEVTLNAINEDGVAAESKTFVVRILKSPAPIITVDPEITYDSSVIKDERELLKDVHARSSDGSVLTSDSQVKVKWKKTGSYTVTLNAVNEDGISANSVQFTVHIVDAKAIPVVIEEKPESTPKPDTKEKVVIKKEKLPKTGDTNTKTILSGIFCLGAWYLLRRK